MPRFAVAATLLLIGIMGAAAAALWYGGWSPPLRVLEAANAPGSADPEGQQDQVARASAAIKAHDVAAVRQYLADGGSPDGADAEGKTLMNMTVLHGTPEILDVLLAAGADPNLSGKNGLGPLTIAALSGRQAMLERLMRANSAGTIAASASPDEGTQGAASAGAVGASAIAADAAPASPPPPAGGTEAAAPPATASSAGDGALPAEPYASMAGLSITPVSRPPAGVAATAASPATGAPQASPPAAPAARPGATAGTGAPAGSVPQAWASAAQRRLGELGYYNGPITGFAGPLTAEAVKRYQAAAGLPQDGVVSADLLRRIGARIDALREAPLPEAPAPAAAPAPPAPPASATVPDQRSAPTPASSRGLQEVRNALGQDFNSATRPDALRQHCQANANAWVYDEAIGRSLFCRDVIGAPPR